MEKRARDMRLVSDPGDEPPPAGKSHDPGLTTADLDAARELAELHHLLAADLPSHSRLRGLVLRCAGHWARLGAIPRNGLAEVERRDRDQAAIRRRARLRRGRR
jgi:hypothetical protein